MTHALEAKKYISDLEYKYKNQFNKINLAKIHWKEFEELIAAIFTLQLGRKVYYTKGSNDHGIDAFIKVDNTLVIFQAKKYKENISPGIVRDLYGTMVHSKATMGFLVTTSNYGPGAYEFVKHKNITLVNGNQLLLL